MKIGREVTTRSVRFLTVLLLTVGLIAFTGAGSLLVADETDAPHLSHLTADRGSGITDCATCHTGIPAFNTLDTGACATCHSTGGVWDGVNDADVGALNNWDNMGDPADATESLIYGVDGNLKPGKDKWCAACHDQPYEMRTKVIDDCEGSLHEWHPLYDAHDPTSPEGIRGQCMHLSIEWDKDTAQDRGRMQRAFGPALDLSGTDAFNFYSKLYHPNGMLRIKKVIVKLRKPGDTVCESSVLTRDLDLTNDE